MLNNRFVDWAENYHVYIEAQTGFRSNMSTSDNVLYGIISHMLNSGNLFW